MDITNKKQKYVVFSNGVVLPGFETTEVTIRLSDIYKMPQDKVSSHLISGKEGKVRSFDDCSKAEQLVAKLTKIGLSCYALSPEKNNLEDKTAQDQDVSQHTIDNDSTTENSDKQNAETSDAVTDDSFSPIDENATGYPNQWIKWAIPTTLLLGLAIAAYYFISK